MVGFRLKLRELFTIVGKNFWKSFVTPPGKRGSAIKLKLFSGIHLLLKVFRFEAFVNRITGKSFTSKSTSRCDFAENYFYRLLSAINSNVDFIVNSIDFQYNIDNKTFMQSSEINILIGAYRQLTTTLILLSILLIFDTIWTITHSCRVQGYIFS